MQEQEISSLISHFDDGNANKFYEGITYEESSPEQSEFEEDLSSGITITVPNDVSDTSIELDSSYKIESFEVYSQISENVNFNSLEIQNTSQAALDSQSVLPQNKFSITNSVIIDTADDRHISHSSSPSPQRAIHERMQKVRAQRKSNIANSIKNLHNDKKDIKTQTVADGAFYIKYPSQVFRHTCTIVFNILLCVTVYFHHHYFFDDTKKLAFILYMYCPTALLILRKFIPFPGETCLRNAFSDTVKDMKKWLKRPDDVNNVLDFLKIPIDKNFRCTIAIDAIAMKLFKKKNAVEDHHNAMFIMYLMPHDNRFNNHAVHVIGYKHGSANEEVREQMKYVLQKLNERIDVPIVVTDGDHGYKHEQDKFFEHWYRKTGRSFDDFVNSIETYDEPIYITDMIHFGKNRRTQLLNSIFTVSPSDPNAVPNLEEMKKTLNLGDTLFDTTDLGKMQDNYAIALFSMGVLKTLYQNWDFNEAFYLLPVTLWFEAVRNEHLNRESRLQMLRISFKIFKKMIDRIKSDDLAAGVGNYDSLSRRKNIIDTKFGMPLEAIQRAASSVLVYYHELLQNENLNFSRLSTMSEEHFNGQIRSGCFHDDTFGHALSFIARYNIAQEFLNYFGINIKKRRRDFTGGVTMNPEVHTKTVILNDEDVVLQSILKNAHWSNKMSDTLSETKFLTFLQYINILADDAAPIKIPDRFQLQLRGQSISNRYHQNTEESIPEEVIQVPLSEEDAIEKIAMHMACRYNEERQEEKENGPNPRAFALKFHKKRGRPRKRPFPNIKKPQQEQAVQNSATQAEQLNESTQEITENSGIQTSEVPLMLSYHDSPTTVTEAKKQEISRKAAQRIHKKTDYLHTYRYKMENKDRFRIEAIRRTNPFEAYEQTIKKINTISEKFEQRNKRKRKK